MKTMIKIFRDMDFDSPNSFIATVDDSFESLVKEKFPKAYLKRYSDDVWYYYQVRIKTGWFSSKPLGDTHYFQDQAWESAYKTITNENQTF
jgi:hypothetical protein